MQKTGREFQEEGCACVRTAGGGDVQIRQRARQQPVQRGVDQHGRQADQVEHEELAHAPVEACACQCRISPLMLFCGQAELPEVAHCKPGSVSHGQAPGVGLHAEDCRGSMYALGACSEGCRGGRAPTQK